MKHFLSIILWVVPILIYAQSPKVLIVNAHPDDESGCAATVYKITQELGGIVDLAVVTNGEAGYKYSILAEKIYKKRLTQESVGRRYLPRIRKKELRAGANWVGIRHIFYFNQLDTHYTLDADTVLTSVWDTQKVKKGLIHKIQENHYDFIFCLLPTPETHGHHKAATILALEAVSAYTGKKPIVLGVSGMSKKDTVEKIFTGLLAYPLTAIKGGHSQFMTDRTASFGYKNKLNYKIVANWLIAEHKSQGTMQTYMGEGDYEKFWYFDINGEADKKQAEALFERLKSSTPQGLR